MSVLTEKKPTPKKVWALIFIGRSTRIWTQIHGFGDRCSTIELYSCGAENEARTRDPNLGKVVLYHWATSAIWRPRTDSNRRSPPWQGGILNQLNYWADSIGITRQRINIIIKQFIWQDVFYSRKVALKLSPTCSTTFLITASMSSSFKVFSLSWKVRLKAIDLLPAATCLPV